MTYDTIREELDDLINTDWRSSRMADIEDAMERLEELQEFADQLNDEDESDTEYEEIKIIIDDLDSLLRQEYVGDDLDDDDMY